MAKCEWSVEGICRCFVSGDGEHPACDGEHALPCNQGRLDLTQVHIPLEDIRARIARAPAPVRDPEPKKNPGRGGKRPGAGAPRGNLNALKDGVYSLQLKRIHREELRILRTAREKRAKRTAGPAPS